MNRIPISTRSALWAGQIDVTDGTLTCGLFAAYTYDPAHEFLDEAGTPADSTLVDAVTVIDGEVFGTVAPFTSPGSGDPANALWFYLDTGTPSTSRLVAFVDRFGDGTPMAIPRASDTITLPPWPSDRLFGIGSPV